jgi:hypothetical protein
MAEIGYWSPEEVGLPPGAVPPPIRYPYTDMRWKYDTRSRLEDDLSILEFSSSIKVIANIVFFTEKCSLEVSIGKLQIVSSLNIAGLGSQVSGPTQHAPY